MLPVLEGVIARRVLLNYRVDPEVAARLIPTPLEPALANGYAVAGICLIRLEHLRPKGLPARIGVSSENFAHRIAIRFPQDGVLQDGVFIWRRDTDRAMVSVLGGRLFPGVHGRATFDVEGGEGTLRYEVRTRGGSGDIRLSVRSSPAWAPTPAFPTFDDVVAFFERGDRGFSCSLSGDRLEGMQLRTQVWQMEPLAVDDVRSGFFSDEGRFPRGTVELDGAVLMRAIPHGWHELHDVPELVGNRQAG